MLAYTVNPYQAMISAPSKTFLLGEYAVLNGDAGIVLCTEPRFEWSEDKGFVDPHKGLGGLGASSAKFAFDWWREHAGEKDWINPLLVEYQRIHTTPGGILPSGYDVIAQITGHITYFSRNTTTLETLHWPFEDLAYCLIRTGHKLATHEHLNQLTLKDTSTLTDIVNTAWQAMQTQNSAAFCECVNQYRQTLFAQGLVAEHTKRLLGSLNAQPFLKAAKGCGAMGADIILALIDKDSVLECTTWCKEQNLAIVAAGQATSDGITDDENLSSQRTVQHCADQIHGQDRSHD